MNARERLIELLDETFEKQHDKNLVITARNTADYLITNGVTVQRHGRWELNKHYGDYECSVCGQGDVIAPYFSNLKMSYCPSCGAKMDEEAII